MFVVCANTTVVLYFQEDVTESDAVAGLLCIMTPIEQKTQQPPMS
jgi:hypothetical protein